MRRWLRGACVGALVLAACTDRAPREEDAAGAAQAAADAGAHDGASADGAASETIDGSSFDDPTIPLDTIPERCRGFDVRGLEYSPGGDVLPNTCAPFHRTRNNPHAVRCIDADATWSSGWPGDEWCILPPAPEHGFQLHLAPARYADPEPAFVAAPRAEITENYYVKAPTSERRDFDRYNVRARPGTHHVFVSALARTHADGWSHDGAVGSEGWRVIAAAQRLDQDLPHETLDVAPENVGVGDHVEKAQQIAFSLHHFNPGDAPALREAWVNFWYAEVRRPIEGIGIFADKRDLAIPPGEHRKLHYRCVADGRTRIVTLWGHRHASTERFGAWIERASGASVSVYESFDFADMPTYQYDSITTNPTPNLAARVDGAYSGVLELEPGDDLHFVCDITNRSEVPLRFANEVLTGEMCGLFGTRVGGPLCEQGERVE